MVAAFMGGSDVLPAREEFVAANLPDYPAPERAVVPVPDEVGLDDLSGSCRDADLPIARAGVVGQPTVVGHEEDERVSGDAVARVAVAIRIAHFGEDGAE